MTARPESGLGAMIRTWRDRLPPSAAGLPTARGRRTAGLRREELADLAGMSVDYIVRLEQGRATTPSASVVASLARALQLSTAERDHLYRLADLVPPTHGTVLDHLPPGVQRVLARLADAAHREDHKTIDHPSVGPVTVDCDTLTDGDCELKIVIMTAAPGSEDETKLRLTAVAGPLATTHN
ncbi:helix-turn-helix domain-containing protein [Streptomyces tauricus]|uniref:helix-turn-helix domain-containing protein n=1 Tax=Streptomyces tauricus TaxID=68274 RepID=UPI0033B8CC4F